MLVIFFFETIISYPAFILIALLDRIDQPYKISNIIQSCLRNLFLCFFLMIWSPDYVLLAFTNKTALDDRIIFILIDVNSFCFVQTGWDPFVTY